MTDKTIQPCLFCGGEGHVEPTGFDITQEPYGFQVRCLDDSCNYRSCEKETELKAIAAHNRVSLAVQAAEERGEPLTPDNAVDGIMVIRHLQEGEYRLKHTDEFDDFEWLHEVRPGESYAIENDDMKEWTIAP